MDYGDIAQTAGAFVLLAAVALGVMSLNGVHVRRDFLGAAVRSIAQLTLVAFIVAWVFANPAGVVVYLVVMLAAAAFTSARRVRLAWREAWLCAVPIALGAALAVGPVLITGALPVEARTVLPFTAQIIGGSMTAVSLAGSRFRDDTLAEWEVVEGYLALGATPQQAVTSLGRRSVERSLIPSLDQMRSAGLVVLPGAFVGMLLGGATPAEAAQVQLLVLFALIAAATTAATTVVWLLAPRFGSRRPGVATADAVTT